MRDQAIEEIAFTIPAWFIEVYTEFKGQPLVLQHFQVASINDTSRFKITNKCRQTGGSLTVSGKQFYNSYRTPGYRCDIVSINLREATDKIKYIRNLHDTLPPRYQIPITTDNQLSIGFHRGASKSVVNSIAASTGVRGGSKAVVFDEFAHIMNDEELFLSAAPAMIHNDYGMEVVSTPNGLDNLFAKIFLNEPDERGRQPYSNWSRHSYIWIDSPYMCTDVDAANHEWEHVYKKDINQMDKLVERYGTEDLYGYFYMYPRAYFYQEFCGSFMNDENAVFPSRVIQQCIKGTVGEAEGFEGEVIKEDFLIPWEKKPDRLPAGTLVTMGVDFGESDKHTDKTAIHVIERSGDIYKQRYHEVLKKTDYPDVSYQEDYIADLILRFKPDRVMADETGLGRGIVPGLRRRNLPTAIEGLTFTNDNKEKMVVDLKVEMERKHVWILEEDRGLQAELGTMRRTTTPSGLHRYEGQPHDDNVWAFAMAVKAANYTKFIITRLGETNASNQIRSVIVP